MKTYCYYEQGVDGAILITEQEIVKQYWEFWYEKMVERYGVDSVLITIDNCILDWCSVHWADEVVE